MSKDHLIRSQLWSNEMRRILMEEFSGMGYRVVGQVHDEIMYEAVALPAVSVPMAVVMGVAAAIIRNSVVTRRLFK